MANSNPADLIKACKTMDEPPIIELQDINKKPVGALYLKTLKNEQISILQPANIDEKYYLYVNGIGIYFSNYSVIIKDN